MEALEVIIAAIAMATVFALILMVFVGTVIVWVGTCLSVLHGQHVSRSKGSSRIACIAGALNSLLAIGTVAFFWQQSGSFAVGAISMWPLVILGAAVMLTSGVFAMVKGFSNVRHAPIVQGSALSTTVRSIRWSLLLSLLSLSSFWLLALAL
jgi:hypothetical protein